MVANRRFELLPSDRKSDVLTTLLIRHVIYIYIKFIWSRLDSNQRPSVLVTACLSTLSAELLDQWRRKIDSNYR